MSYPSPCRNVAGAPFRYKTMNMGIPLKVTAEGVKNTDETGSKVFRFVKFRKQPENNASYSRKKTI